MSPEQLGNVEVTTVSKQPEEVWRTPAAVYALTREDIERSGATTIADLLRLEHREGVGDDGNLAGIRRSVFAELRWTH